MPVASSKYRLSCELRALDGGVDSVASFSVVPANGFATSFSQAMMSAEGCSESSAWAKENNPKGLFPRPNPRAPAPRPSLPAARRKSRRPIWPRTNLSVSEARYSFLCLSFISFFLAYPVPGLEPQRRAAGAFTFDGIVLARAIGPTLPRQSKASGGAAQRPDFGRISYRVLRGVS